MTTESKRKTIDYSASAVNLKNPPELCDLLGRLYEAHGNANEIKDRIDASIPADLIKASEKISETIASLNTEIRTAIDIFGSYQDTINGIYAIKQRRESIIYKPELVRQYAPSKVASFVIIESVDSKALDALVKAGQISSETARQCGEVKESFAYIVKV